MANLLKLLAKKEHEIESAVQHPFPQAPLAVDVYIPASYGCSCALLAFHSGAFDAISAIRGFGSTLGAWRRSMCLLPPAQQGASERECAVPPRLFDSSLAGSSLRPAHRRSSCATRQKYPVWRTWSNLAWLLFFAQLPG